MSRMRSARNAAFAASLFFDRIASNRKENLPKSDGGGAETSRFLAQGAGESKPQGEG